MVPTDCMHAIITQLINKQHELLRDTKNQPEMHNIIRARGPGMLCPKLSAYRGRGLSGKPAGWEAQSACT